MSPEYIIAARELTHEYNNGFKAVKKLNFNIAPGEFTAIIGQNGAGKTTLVKHFNGLLKPTGGQLIVAGKDTAKEKVSTLAKKVGFVFQNPDHQIFKDTVEKEVAFGPENLHLPSAEIADRVKEALEAVGLSEYARTSPQNLSKGQRQRVALASVLAMRTDVIVLDEPTTGQDYKESLQIMELARELNKSGHTILFITHDMNLVARYAKRAIVLCAGEIILDGPVNEIFQQVETLNRTYLHPPQIVELAMALALKGDNLTPEDFYYSFINATGRVADGSGS